MAFKELEFVEWSKIEYR